MSMRRATRAFVQCTMTAVVPRLSLPPSSIFMACRFQTTSTTAAKPAEADSHRPVGIVNISSAMLTAVTQSEIPTLVYLFNSKSEEHLEYCDILVRQVEKLNKEQRSNAVVFNGRGADTDLSMKLALADVTKERSMAEKFRVDTQVDVMPQVFFVRNGTLQDKMQGVVVESMVIEAVTAFFNFCLEEAKGDGKPMKKTDDTEENPMSLLQAAQVALKEKNYPRCRMCYEKALEMAIKYTEPIRNRLGFDRKTPTETMIKQLRKQGVYNAAPQALAGLTMLEMIEGNRPKAIDLIARIRKEYPYAITDLRDVASAVAKVEILVISDLPLNDGHSYTLHNATRIAEEGGAEFYKRNLQIAADFYLNQRLYAGSMDLLLRLIRAEVKLLPELKAAKIVPEDTVLSGMDCTPARKVLRLIFDALGESLDLVVDYRKKAQALV